MSRKALFVGINHYDYSDTLSGCVNDATILREVLSKHGDGDPNFSNARLLVDNGKKRRREIRP